MTFVPHSCSFSGHILGQILPESAPSPTPTSRKASPLLAAPEESMLSRLLQQMPGPHALCPSGAHPPKLITLRVGRGEPGDVGKGQQEMPTLLAIVPATVARARFSEHLSVRELWTPRVLGLNSPGGPPPPPPLASHGSNQHSLPEFPAMGPHPPGAPGW